MVFKLKASIYSLFISSLISAGETNSDIEKKPAQTSNKHRLIRAQSLMTPLGLICSFDKRCKSAPIRRRLLPEEPDSGHSLFRAKYGLSNVDRRQLASVLASFTRATGSRTSRASSDSLISHIDGDDPGAGLSTPMDINSSGFSALQTPRGDSLKLPAPGLLLTSPGGTTFTISSSNTPPSEESPEESSSSQ